MSKLLLLIALPFSAFSQVINLPKPGPARLDGATVCLTVPVATRVRDSLTALPLVRKEAGAWRTAARHYRSAADSARGAYVAQVSASLNTQAALRTQQIETTRARVEAKQWRGKAQRRGWLNWLLAIGTAAGAGFAIAH